MKRVFTILVFFIALIFTFSSCSKIRNSTDGLNANATRGKWKITLFDESNKVKTDLFDGYVFEFVSNTAVMASSSSYSYNGIWSSELDDSELKMTLDFGTTSPFDKLNDDWHVESQSNITIVLKDESGGAGGDHHLTFEKL